ncbi:SDR family NAD(P)-dependent oxidoreductase [Melittangium boletus]|uniref:Polyketide synthase n=1 Tax=Melittangium boletus DSM 14713 TaxID=1294270 RepID=A0A250IAN1_9BACT|nr:type I polyketide synthase [Melittangium boletus]ATB28248.1 polyketide synthase [Melittangium boletus DSM 14713]
MSRNEGSAPELTPLQQALLTIEKLQRKLAAGARPEEDTIAIIGMGCRFPGGATSPSRFRDLLWGAGDGVRDIPADRQALQGLYDPDPSRPGKMSMRRAAFVDGVERFDAEFFRISRREAEGMDPQQRFFLEVSWEALEDAGIPPHRLLGSRTGVFAGVHAKDYAFLANGGLEKVGPHYSTGVDASYVAGRLSYLLGLEGPSMAVDTACSSSLAAVHLACQSLRTQESTLAIAGGVKLILSPHLSVFLSKAGALSPSSRCRAFDGAADGMVQGEGCGVVILKRYRDAVRDGDRIHAVIRATAMNHDGASGGLTVPNVRAQESLYRLALQRAGIEPGQVDYLEAHGTGTRLGDPIELEGVSRVYGASRPKEQPLWMGSVKPNIGHTEAAAGVAGLIKAVLVLQSAEAPPSLHFENPNPEFAWEGSGIAVPQKRTPLADKARPHRVAVSSFGMSGVNAHALVESHQDKAAPQPDAGPYLLPLSARGEPALRELAAAYLNELSDRPTANLREVCFTAGAGRSPQEHRLALVARTRDELLALLRDAVNGREGQGLIRGQARTAGERDAIFVFGDDASGVGERVRGLLERDASFRAQFQRLEGTFRQVAGGSALEKGTGSEAGPREAVLLCLFQIALAEQWRSYGIEPAAVAGQGTGEVSAGVIAGVLTVEEAIQLVLQRPEARPAHAQPARCAFFSSADAAWVEPGATPGAQHWEKLRASGTRPGLAASHLLARKASTILVFAAELESEVLVLRADSKGDDAGLGLLGTAARLYCAGFSLRFDILYPQAKKTALPTYPWQHERYWWDGEQGAAKVTPTVALPVVAEGGKEDTAALDALFCSLSWSAREENAAEPVRLDGTWLVAGADAKATGELQEALASAGGSAIEVDLSGPESFTRQLGELSSAGREPRGVVFVARTGHPDTSDGLHGMVRDDAVAVTSIVRALARQAASTLPRLYLVTRGAQLINGETGTVSLAGAPLWGLGRVIVYEHPELRCKRIDADPSAGPESLRQLVAELGREQGATGDEDEIALRGGKRLAPSLIQGRQTKEASGSFRPRQDRTYLITGGLGGIGLRLASWLVARGARHLAVCGRSGETAENRQTLETLRAAGARVEAFRVDVSRPDSVSGMLEHIRRGDAPLGGIFHCAGVLADGSLLQLDPRSFDTVLGPKVDGAWNLHTLATDASLEQFVLFSSTASLVGSAGQANYATANAFLDALAHLRRARGLPAISLNWGSWGEVGMAAVDARRGERLAERGMEPMSVDDALAAMGVALADGPVTQGLARFNAERWVASHPSVATSSLFRAKLDSEPESATDKASRKLREVLLSLEGPARRVVLDSRLKQMVSEVSRIPSERISSTDTFDALGFDSIMALEMRDLVTGELEINVPLKRFVDAYSIEQVTAELLEKLAVASVLGASSSERTESKRVLL